jgi:hypothetical protein
MAIARFKKLRVDCADLERVGVFWANALGRTWRAYDADSGGVFGLTPRHTIWFTRGAAPKTAKNRVHFDIYAQSLAGLEVLGATVVLPEGDDRRWTVMADPEGNEFCAFLRDEIPEDRLHGLVVDCADPRTQAQWWADVYGAPVGHHERGWSTVEKVPDMPILTFDFNPVPEPKTAANRVRWDVTVDDVAQLVAVGATVMREEQDFTLLTDPEGNEFGAYLPPISPTRRASR